MPGKADRQSGDAPANTFLRFLNTYPNTLFRFSTPSRRSSAVSELPSNASSSSKAGDADHTDEGMMVASAAEPRRAAVASLRTRAYPLSTVIIVALIAFLVGSLLRSLLSPADFIYVVTDRKEIDEGEAAGWREIKRLLEVKYMIGGWDFQVAVVRRH